MSKNDKSPLVSVIVPIYNSEPYLRGCLDSILHQTYKNLEIILVDDKSRDNSRVVAQEYAESDKRITLICKKTNQGINPARRTGFEHSTGEYIMFVDNDDFISSDSVASHLSAIRTASADISIAKTVWWNDTDTIDQKEVFERGGGSMKILEKKLAYRSLITETSPFAESEVGMLWNRLHKRSFFEGYDWNLSNMPAEDFMTNAYLFNGIKSVVYIDKVQYIHRINNQSTMGRLAQKRGANAQQEIDIFDALFKVSEVFNMVARENCWDFKNEIIYFKYRYFYIRMEAFISKNTLSDTDFKKMQKYTKQSEIATLCSDDFTRYISEYLYAPASDILISLVQYWQEFSHANTLAEFLEMRNATLVENIIHKDRTIRYLEATVQYNSEVMRSLQSLRGSTFNFLGKVKHRLILRAFRAPRILIHKSQTTRLRKKYKDCWLVMDREDSASDNGYVFYTYLLENYPEINAYFAINADSSDVPRLRKEGFKLVFIGTKEHDIAIEESSKLFYAYFTFEYSNNTARRIFLGHGITKDSLPNPGIRSNDYFITALEQEQEFLSERTDMTVVRTGLPRHERLISKMSDPQKEMIIIAPTWRPWLYSNENTVNRSDAYFANWQQLLDSEELRKLSDHYEVVFILHPMMRALEKKIMNLSF